jgi:hypothetical protein
MWWRLAATLVARDLVGGAVAGVCLASRPQLTFAAAIHATAACSPRTTRVLDVAPPIQTDGEWKRPKSSVATKQICEAS